MAKSRLPRRSAGWAAGVALPRPITVVLYLLAETTGVALILWRTSGPTPAWQSMWAEDGAVFMPAARLHGFLTNLFTPYAGYLHLAPRTLAQIDALFPVQAAAWLFAVEGSAVATCCALVVFAASREWLQSRAVRAAMAASMLLLPIAGYELLANVTNLQWFLTPTVVWVLLWRPTTRGQRGVAAVMALLAAGSQPMTAGFLPILLWRLATLRNWRDHVVTTAFALGLGAQVWALAAHRQPSAASLGYVHGTASQVAKLFGVRVGLGLFAGTRYGADLWQTTRLLAVLGIATLVAILFVLGRRAPMTSRWIALYCLGASIVLFAFTNWDRYLRLALSRGQDPMQWNSRYAYVPLVLVLFTLAVLADHVATTPGWGRVVLGIASLAVLLFWLPGLRTTNARMTEVPWSRAVALKTFP